ncbi:hypothetical protein C3R44_23805, partial [Mycobacterium tuberculosis]
PSHGAPLGRAAPAGLAGAFAARLAARFPVFRSARLAAALPGPLPPLPLAVPLRGLRAAGRALGRVLALGGVVAAAWARRAL